MSASREKNLSSVTMSIAVPIALQSLVAFGVNMVDTVMLGQMGEIPLSASALANQIFFIVSMAVGGIADGANVMASQAWGKGDVTRIHRILAYTYRIALGFLVVMTLGATLIPAPLLRIYTGDAVVIGEGASYLRIVGFSYLFYGLTTITTGVLRAVHTVKIAMIASFFSMGVNVALNWILIFGKFGAPVLGIKGAAIATLIARIAEFILVMCYMAFKEKRLQLSVKKLIPTDRAILPPYLKTSAPVIANEFFWSLGESAIAMVLGRMGTEVVAANSIAGVMNQLAGVLSHGVSAAACVIVGNTIGAGKYGELPVLKKYFQRFAILMGCLAMVLILAAMPFTLRLYKVGELTLRYARQLILVTAFIQPFGTFQITNMMGILRGGGDVNFAMLNDLIFLWCLTVPLGFLGGIVLGLPPAAVFILLRVEKICKSVTSERRLRSGKWIHNTTGADSPLQTESPA